MSQHNSKPFEHLVKIAAHIAGEYCFFEVGEMVKVKPAPRAKTWTVERAVWRNSLTISNVLAFVPEHILITEPPLPSLR
jgi:hypothetical protein